MTLLHEFVATIPVLKFAAGASYWCHNIVLRIRNKEMSWFLCYKPLRENCLSKEVDRSI